MIKTFKTLAVTTVTCAALALTATSGSATTFVYDLFDNPDAAFSQGTDNHEYGLRLDHYNGTAGLIFSFGHDGTSNATLEYNDMSGEASIRGTMFLSDIVTGSSLTDASDPWTVEYDMTGVTNTGSGLFTDTVGGSGRIFNDTTTYLLGTADREGDYFILSDDSSRIPDGFDNPGTIVGEGWVNPLDDHGQPVNSTNDFLFLAELQGGDDGGEEETSPVPLPAAAWMLLAGVGGLGAMRRFGKKSS